MLDTSLINVIKAIGADIKAIRETITGKQDKPSNGEFVTRADVEQIIDDKLNSLVVDEVAY